MLNEFDLGMFLVFIFNVIWMLKSEKVTVDCDPDSNKKFEKYTKLARSSREF